MSAEIKIGDLPALYSSLPKNRAEMLFFKDEEEVVDKGTLTLCGKEVHGVKIFPGRHDVFHHKNDNAHPGECCDFGLTNYMVIRNLHENPYPLDIFVCRRPGCEEVMVQDPLSEDEIVGVFRKSPIGVFKYPSA